LYPFCKLKDLPSRKTSSSEERKQHHEAIGPDKNAPAGGPPRLLCRF
jgi:hypothetical protein